MWHFSSKSGIPFLTALAVLQGCNNQAEKIDQRGLPEEVIPGSFVVQLKDFSASEEEDVKTLKEIGNLIADKQGCEAEVEKISWARSSEVMSSELAKTFNLRLSDCDINDEQTEKVLDELLAEVKIETAAADSLMRISVEENDQYKSRQYYLDNIKREAACDATSGQGAPVVVAVVDSGVQNNHPDLVDNFYKDSSGRVIGANFVGKGSGQSPDSNWNDGNGHGTHVAGLIGATANNSRGIAGVASCQNIKIMPVRVMGPNGQGSSVEINRGVQWAAANGADIINLSLGSNSIQRSKMSSHYSSLYEDLAKQGVIVFAAAGNDGFRNGSAQRGGYRYSYPASYDNVIAVGATDARNNLTNFSVYGDHIDIAAPGHNTLSTYIGGTYQALSGTSMATPIAVGTYALALSAARKQSDKKLYHDEVENIFKDTVNTNVSFPRERILVGGIVDTAAILAKVKENFGSGEDDDFEPAPNPIRPTPDEPVDPEPTPAEPGSFGFVGLEDGQRMTSGQTLTVSNWPEGTSRVNLYWITGNEFRPRVFTSLGSEHLSRDRSSVTTSRQYLLYGDRYLVAEAVDPYGRRLKVQAIRLQGL